MAEQMLSVRDAAVELGMRKQTIFKVMKRLGITGVKRRDASARNQLVSYITQSEVVRIRDAAQEKLLKTNGEPSDDGFISAEVGVFYLLQLEPEHDPTRFKVGFAANMEERLRTLKCSAPFITVWKTWPCKRLWEKTVIDCVTTGCEQLHTEVFRCNSIESVATKCDVFFGMMPDIASITIAPGDAEESEEIEDG